MKSPSNVPRRHASRRRRSLPELSPPRRRPSSSRRSPWPRRASGSLARVGAELRPTPKFAVRYELMKAPAPRHDHVLRITGGAQLAGDICISGSKNAALPEMAAALLTTDPVRLNNVPRVTDTKLMGEILTGLGGRCEGEGSLIIKMGLAQDTHVPDDLGRRMRATIVLLGALLGRLGKA